jgi:O-antigen ligase
MKALCALLLGGVFQAVIAIGQFFQQGSLGLTSFGESVIGPHMQGVASFFVASGEKVIRAYGTTPHPNVLAAYLFLTVVAFYFVVFHAKSKYYDSLIYQSIVHGVILFGLFFTFSRTIIFLFFMNFFVHGFLVNFVKRFRDEYSFGSFFKTKVLPVFLVTVIVTTTFVFFYWPEVQSRMTLSSEEEAVQLRVFYNEESLKGRVNLFGIGLGDFTGWLMEQNLNLPRYMYQPVHNIYLLIYSEIGIIGFVLFLLFLVGLFYEFVKKTQLRDLTHYSFLLVAVLVLLIGLFDHFLLTLQQGRFVFWLGLTILAIGDIRKEQSERS